MTRLRILYPKVSSVFLPTSTQPQGAIDEEIASWITRECSPQSDNGAFGAMLPTRMIISEDFCIIWHSFSCQSSFVIFQRPFLPRTSTLFFRLVFPAPPERPWKGCKWRHAHLTTSIVFCSLIRSTSAHSTSWRQTSVNRLDLRHLMEPSWKSWLVVMGWVVFSRRLRLILIPSQFPLGLWWWKTVCDTLMPLLNRSLSRHDADLNLVKSSVFLC